LPIAVPGTTETQQDPGGVQAAIDRYRDLAKYLITVFAGVGALLVAGTQLASIGKLSWSDTRDRVLAAGIGLALAVAAIATIVAIALRVLRPVEMSLDDVVADPVLRAYVDSRPSLLGTAGDVKTLRDIVSSSLLDEDERPTWSDIAQDVVNVAAYRRMRSTFEGSWRWMLIAAIAGVIGVSAFAWGANPPESVTASPIVAPAPVSVSFTLTREGRDALSSALGQKCVTRTIHALSIGGTEGAPVVVTLPDTECRAAQFVLNAEWGAATSIHKAPAH
jgi:hypothetical protein